METNTYQWPIDYNSVTNLTVQSSDSIYIMFKSASIPEYTVCQMRGFLSTACSTRYNVTVSGRFMEAHCEDPKDVSQFARFLPQNISQAYPAPDYQTVLATWALALNLNGGLVNANSTAARLLSELVINPSGPNKTLNPLLPSLAESLSVMSASLLMTSAINSSFSQYDQYGAPILEPGVLMPFNASIRTQQYTSGAVLAWQQVFYFVLFTIFWLNLGCLGYFCVRMGLLTDVTGTMNAFVLALNSPFSKRIVGACGSGPSGKQLQVEWFLRRNENRHYYFEEGNDGDGYELRRRNRPTGSQDGLT